jgi:DNA-binding protein HU-beta
MATTSATSPTRQEVAVNKGELVEAMAQRAGLDRRQAEGAFNAFVETVMEAVRGGDKVGIVGFGTFNPTSRGARTGRNPRTGEAVKIAASKSVRFAPGAAFKSSLNSGGGAKKAASSKKAATKATAKKASASKASAKKATAKKAAKSTKKR